MRSPTARTLNYLRKQPDTFAEVVEKWIPVPKHPGGGIRRDLFKCIDIVCIMGRKLVGIQSTSGSNHSSRLTKALENEMLPRWLDTNTGFEVWSWSKRGPRGKRKLWTPKVTQLTIRDGKVVIV